MQHAAVQYRKEVSRQLPCPAALKRAFLHQLEEEALCFCAEHPEADIHTLCTHFGAPQEVAEEFLAELTDRTVTYYTHKRRQIFRSIIAVIATTILILLFFGFMNHCLQNKLIHERFIASITYECASEGGTSKNPAHDTILGSSKHSN